MLTGSFSLFLSKRLGRPMGYILLAFLLICLFLSSERTVIYKQKLGKTKIVTYSSLERMSLLRTHLDLVCKTNKLAVDSLISKKMDQILE